MSRHVLAAAPPLAGAALLLATTLAHAQVAAPPPAATTPGPDAYRTMPVRPVDPQWLVTAAPMKPNLNALRMSPKLASKVASMVLCEPTGGANATELLTEANQR